jgi:hypothetical protein
MNHLLLLSLLCFTVPAQGQNKKDKPFQWPKPIKDSTWVDAQSDTLHGTIEYSVGQGKVIGDGILVTTKFWHRHKTIYRPKDQQKIDSFYYAERQKNGIVVMRDGSAYSSSDESRTTAYIKTSKGWEFVISKFVFKPKSLE